MINLNLGSGSQKIKNYINVDKFNTFNPDVIHDLDVTPYPFEENSVDNIMLSHVLEHIGRVPDNFNNIMKELYRICKNGSKIEIITPHPRHDNFISDPTHVRPITILGMSLYDKAKNEEWIKKKVANSPLALIHKVNFKIIKSRYDLDKRHSNLIEEQAINSEELNLMIAKYNNIVEQIYIQLEVVK